MLPSKYLIGICMTSFWISCSSCCNYFGCTSFFVDIYHHDFVYLEPYTLERNYISRWYLFFHVHLVLLLLFLWWLRESFCLECVSYLVASWCTLVWWRLFSSCLSWRGLIGIPCLDDAYAFYLHLGLSQVLVIHFAYLVFLWTHLLSCVWEWKALHSVSHSFKTMLMLMLIRILVFSCALPWLTHIILVEPILKLPLLLVAQPCVCSKY